MRKLGFPRDHFEAVIYDETHHIVAAGSYKRLLDYFTPKFIHYLGRMTASGQAKEIVMPNTTKTAVEIEWMLGVPVREDIYQYIVNR